MSDTSSESVPAPLPAACDAIIGELRELRERVDALAGTRSGRRQARG